MKRYFIICLFVVAILFALQSPLFAALWYVDGTLDSGSNNGTSWTNAWRSFADVVWGPNGVKAGDTLFISGGATSKTYTEQWSVAADGSPGRPITISIGQDAGHNGVAIFDYDYLGDSGNGTGIYINRKHITLTGKVNGERHIRVQNLRNTSNRVTAMGIGGLGTNVSNVIVESVEIINCNNGIYFSRPAGVIIRQNKISSRGDAAIGLVVSVGTWDANLVYDNEIELLFNKNMGGPDGIQGATGISIYNNLFWITEVDIPTSTQHSDMLQITGNYLKIYNNEFINVGDSAIDYDAWSNESPSNVWIFNNLFRITKAIDPYPEYIRLYSSGGTAIKSLNDWIIANNTFVDNLDFPSIRMTFSNGSPTTNNFQIKNNIFYNCGKSTHIPVISIGDSEGFTDGSFDFAANIYYHPFNKAFITYRGVSYTALDWINNRENSAVITKPLFVRYFENGNDNDFRLSESDLAAKDRGLDLSAYFTADKLNVKRPKGSGFDIGAYEYMAGTEPLALPLPQNLRIIDAP